MDMTWPLIPSGTRSGARRQSISHLAGERIDVAVTADMTVLKGDWLAFQAGAAGTFFQTYQWCSAWLDTVGAALNVEPLIVTGRFEGGGLAFLLPLCIRRSGGVRLVEWMATGQSSYGYGLFDPNFLPGGNEWFAAQGWDILRKFERADAVHLRDMPQEFYGFPHPLSGWFSFAGANSSHVMKLEQDFEAFYCTKRSPATRRGNRKRDAKLFSCGNAVFGLPQSSAETHELLDTMFAHKESRLSENGVARLFGESERALIHRLADATDAGQPILLPYHLKIDGQLAAMMLGGCYAGTYWALISSLAPGNMRKYSPGDAALRRTIQACCERSLTTFDFSSGDMPYKFQWADRSIRLHDSVRILSWRGCPWALAQTAGLLLKRLIKRSPPLWTAALAVRKHRAKFKH